MSLQVACGHPPGPYASRGLLALHGSVVGKYRTYQEKMPLTRPSLQGVERRPGGPVGRNWPACSPHAWRGSGANSPGGGAPRPPGRAPGSRDSRGRCGAWSFASAYDARAGRRAPCNSVGRGLARGPERAADRRRIAAQWTSRSPPSPRNPDREDAANRREVNARGLRMAQEMAADSDPP